jgi:acylphosphatase
MDLRTIITTLVLATLLAIPTTDLRAAEPESKTPVRKHWFVSGQVQGVSFRAFTYESATDLKLNGWVRNLTDRRVEIVAEGSEKSVTQLLEKVKKGPPASRVDAVKEAKVDDKEKLAGHFEIRDSAPPPP